MLSDLDYGSAVWDPHHSKLLLCWREPNILLPELSQTQGQKSQFTLCITIEVLNDAQPYGLGVPIVKYECIGHIQKRVGKAFMNLRAHPEEVRQAYVITSGMCLHVHSEFRSKVTELWAKKQQQQGKKLLCFL